MLARLDEFLEKRIAQFERNRRGFILGCGLLVAAGFYAIYTSVTGIIVNANLQTMYELADHDKQAIHSSVYFRQQEIENLSESLWRHRILSLQGLHEYLRNTNDQFGMLRISAVCEEGRFYSSNGTSKKNEDYLKLIKANPQGFVSRYGGKNGVLLFGMPVHPFRVENERFEYILGEVLLRDLADSMEIDSYEGQGHSFVIDSNGDFIIASAERPENNIFERYKGAKVSGFAAKEDFHAAVLARQRVTGILDYNGREYVLTSSPADYNWTIITVVPRSVFSGLTYQLTTIFSVLALFILGAVGTVVVLLLRSRENLNRQKVKEEHFNAIQEKNAQLQEKQAQLEELTCEQEAQIEETNALNTQLQEKQAKLEEVTCEQEAQIEETNALNIQLQEKQAKLEEVTCEQEAQIEEIRKLNDKLEFQYDLVQAIQNIYFAAYYVDIDADSYVTIDSLHNMAQVADEQSGAQATFNAIIEKLVISDNKEELLDFLNLSTLDQRMNDKGVITCDYVGITSGWSQIALIVSDRREDDTISHLIVAIKKIHDEKAREAAHNEELRKAMETAESANAAKTSFLFNMSHDIRTPMNAIVGFRDLLEKHQEEPEKRAEYLRKIQESSTVLLSIINNVLEMARIEKGTVLVEEVPWSVQQFNDTLYSIFQEMMEEKGLTFSRVVEVEHPYVLCDALKLREIFINLLSNAYKYSRPGASITMHLRELPSGKEGVALYQTTITDTGIGMSEEFLPHIFEEFSRERNTTEAKIEGTGLGMPIVKKLVDILGGTINVASKKGKGTTFVVTLPHKITDKANLVPHTEGEIDLQRFKDKRILLAEDYDFNAEIAIEMLEDVGFVVDRAEDGQICVDMLARAQEDYYSLVLMDIQMPNMNGYEATKAIRNMRNPSKSRIPILAMTANAFDEDKAEAFKAGMDGHLAKPVRLPELVKALAAILGR